MVIWFVIPFVSKAMTYSVIPARVVQLHYSVL